MDGLTAAIERLYGTFDSSPPPAIEGCPCCIDTRNVDVLLSMPLRSISGQALWRYVSGAFLTVGGQRDFRYLLPRIFEVSVTDPGNANHPPIVLGKLTRAGWRSWAIDEQRAIEAFIDAWLDRALADDLAAAAEGWVGCEAESVLCGAAYAGMPVAPLLERFVQPHAAPVAAALREQFEGKRPPFWEEVPEAFDQVRAFLNERAD